MDRRGRRQIFRDSILSWPELMNDFEPAQRNILVNQSKRDFCEIFLDF